MTHAPSTVTTKGDAAAAPLPPGWQSVKLGEVVTEAQAGFAAGERDPSGVIQLRMNNVTKTGTWDWSSFIRVPADKDTVNYYALRPGDVLFNNTNSTEMVGKSAVFEGQPEPVVFSNHFTRIRTRPEQLEPAFLGFWLLCLWQRGEFSRLCDRWIGQSAVQRSKLLALELPLPPLSEQKRIATRLRDQLAAVAVASAAVQGQFGAAQHLPAVQLRATYTSAAAKWPKCRLGDVLRLRKEVVHPRDNPHGSAVFVGLEHVQPLTGERIGSLPVEMSELTGRKPRFYTGDIVYGYLRPYLNKLWVAEFDGLCSVDQYVYEVNQHKADTSFVAWFMRSPVYLERAPIDTTPGQLPRIRTEEVSSVEINLPPLRQQKAVVSQLQTEFAETTALKETLSARKKALDHMPAALLREAFAGRV